MVDFGGGDDDFSVGLGGDMGSSAVFGGDEYTTEFIGDAGVIFGEDGGLNIVGDNGNRGCTIKARESERKGSGS